MSTRQFTIICASIALILALITIVQAQNCPWYEKPSWKSTDAVDEKFTMSVALSDLDNDGDLDLIAGKYKYPYFFDTEDPGEINLDDIGGGLYAYRNFHELDQEISPTATEFISGICVDCIAMGDYDNDGDMDVALGCVVGKGNDGGVRVYKNRKYPNGASWNSLFQGNPDFISSSYDCHCVRWVDFDGDGDLDLAALEIPGMIHIYVNDDGVFDPEHEENINLDFYTSIAGPQNGTLTRDLSDNPLNIPITGTTMEFGDMNGDDLLDMYVNISATPTVYKNLGGATWYSCLESNAFYLDHPKKATSCGSFGRYFCNGENHVALATGCMTTNASSISDYGNCIYVLDEANNRLELVGYSDVIHYTPQMVTDIQWGQIDNDANQLPDLVAAAYPWYNRQNETYSWQRGREQVHLNLSGEYIPPNFMPTNPWTETNGYPDLSTCLALGDCDYGDYPDLIEGSPSALDFDPSERLIYVSKFPFVRLTRVAFCNNAGNELEYWTPNPNGHQPVGFTVTYNPVNGWISINKNYPTPANSAYIKVVYSYGSHLDLAVGNDGPDVLYYYGAPSGQTNEQIPPDLSAQFPDLHPPDIHEYQAPSSWASQNTLDLMNSSSIGAPIPNDFSKLPNMRMFTCYTSWSQIEMFRGHYFWDQLDKILNSVYESVPTYHKNHATILAQTCAGPEAPLWTLGNYNPNPGDHWLRTSDERLHTLFLRNLVNRFRPEGLFASQSYTWDDWGIKMYQAEFESNLDGGGYGDFDDAYKAIAEKMYREYQIIKQIDPALKVISPNPTNLWVGENTTKYMGPDIPYFHKINETNLPFIDNLPSDPCDRAVWRFCDYIATSLHCGLYTATTPLNFKDPFTSIFTNSTPPLPLGVDHNLWGFYTPGLVDYYNNPPGQDWSPLIDEAHLQYEKPFFIHDWHFNPYHHASSESEALPQADWISSEVVKLASVDVFPTNPNRNHYLVEFQCAWLTNDYPQIFNTMAGGLND